MTLRAVVFQEPDTGDSLFVAVCLECFIATQSNDELSACRALLDALAAHDYCVMELGGEDPFDYVGPAEQKFFDMYSGGEDIYFEKIVRNRTYSVNFRLAQAKVDEFRCDQ